jgi:hypothetical protein
MNVFLLVACAASILHPVAGYAKKRRDDLSVEQLIATGGSPALQSIINVWTNNIEIANVAESASGDTVTVAQQSLATCLGELPRTSGLFRDTSVHHVPDQSSAALLQFTDELTLSRYPELRTVFMCLLEQNLVSNATIEAVAGPYLFQNIMEFGKDNPTHPFRMFYALQPHANHWHAYIPSPQEPFSMLHMALNRNGILYGVLPRRSLQANDSVGVFQFLTNIMHVLRNASQTEPIDMQRIESALQRINGCQCVCVGRWRGSERKLCGPARRTYHLQRPGYARSTSDAHQLGSSGTVTSEVCAYVGFCPCPTVLQMIGTKDLYSRTAVQLAVAVHNIEALQLLCDATLRPVRRCLQTA